MSNREFWEFWVVILILILVGAFVAVLLDTPDTREQTGKPAVTVDLAFPDSLPVSYGDSTIYYYPRMPYFALEKELDKNNWWLQVNETTRAHVDTVEISNPHGDTWRVYKKK